MDMQGLIPPPVKPQRCRHFLEYNALVLAACAEPGTAIAAVAPQLNINATQIHNWRRTTEATCPEESGDFVDGPLVIYWPMDHLGALTHWLRTS